MFCVVGWKQLRPDNSLDVRDVEPESQDRGEAESQPLIDDETYGCLSQSQHTDAEAEVGGRQRRSTIIAYQNNVYCTRKQEA
jgi:hypothetical protein